MNRYLAFFFCLTLVGCGGGSASNSSGSNPASNAGPTFVSWEKNANDTVILDATGRKFAVLISGRELYDFATNTSLTKTNVSQNGDVYINNSLVGRVITDYASGTTTTIAFLACSGPAPNLGAMTVSISASGYSYSCASNTGAGTLTGTSGGDGIPASGCLGDGGALNGYPHSLYNSCGVKVYYTYCVTGYPGSLFSCDKPPATQSFGYSYGQGADSIAPGARQSVIGQRAGDGVVWFACSIGPSGKTPLPFLTQVNPPKGLCR